MTDYIKREDAVRRIAILMAAEAESDGCEDQSMENYIEYASEDLADIPSADVAPVRHGRWIECTSSPHWKCSMCGTKAPIWFDEFNEICEWLSVYCPNCGAKMDEERKDNGQE